MTIRNEAPPLLALIPEGAGMESTREQPQTGARKVVIVVEDEPVIGALIADAISDEPGYAAIHVAAAPAALEATRHVIPDLMVVDVRLPGMSGFELYDQLKKDARTSKIPVLFETASGPDVISEFRRRGIATYVKKPFDLNVIVAYVKRLARGPSAGSPPGSALPRRA
ncbi:MAG: response regulator [Chloroflexi bacterium]|nr:MAG: response regulator [Chloroflexota bacterium]